MNILIFGAKLQGVEAIYLSEKAKYHVMVIDKNEKAIGSRMADEFLCADLFCEESIREFLEQADVYLPVIENIEVIEKISFYAKKYEKKLLFDIEAYRISSLKEKSNQLFRDIHLPMPEDYPECEYPVVMKPDGSSGSENVRIAYSEEDVKKYLGIYEKPPVIQEYLQGKSYSLEVLGNGKEYLYPLITEVIIDKQYDCKRIQAPAVISEDEKNQFYNMAKKLAKVVGIHGIFDIEVISHHGQLKILEIDARLPSQTPISIFHATGFNMVKALAEEDFDIENSFLKEKRYCLYQQIKVNEKEIQVLGEHIMTEAEPLHIEKQFFGADEAITDFDSEKNEWYAIVIINGNTVEDVYEKLDIIIRNIKKYYFNYFMKYIDE